MKKLFTRFQEIVLLVSGWFTSIMVLLIVFFLFKEGFKIFGKKPVEEGFVMAVHPNNLVNSISPGMCKDIFDGKIENWERLGGRSYPIELATLEDIGSLYTEEEIGSEMEHLDSCFNDYINKHEGALISLPKSAVSSSFKGKIISVKKISLNSFIRGIEWFPTSKPVAQFGILPLITGTLLVSLGAILFALPLGLACAIYMAEITNKRTRSFMKPIVELLAGIPSVVYGFFGLVVIVPLIQKVFHLDVGETALSGSIILGIMALPTIITISEDALRNVPVSMREASIALGATKWQTISKVLIPYSLNGITTAIALGIGRAIGETMAVLMVTGNAGNLTLSYLKPIRTIPATIAAELGEAPAGGMHYQALFTLGCVLFVFTLAINIYINFVTKRRRM